MGISREHRTLLVIDAASVNAPKFLEDRVKRLLESVNGPGILVDVAVGSGSNLTSIGTSPEAAIAQIREMFNAPAAVDESAIRATARDLGYDQVIVSVSPRR